MLIVYEIVNRHYKYSRRGHSLVTDKTDFLFALYIAIHKGSASVRESNK